MAAAIWSTPMDKIGEYPVESMLAFLRNHGLLKLINRPQWHFVKNGSASYIDAIIVSSNINTSPSSKLDTSLSVPDVV